MASLYCVNVCVWRAEGVIGEKGGRERERSFYHRSDLLGRSFDVPQRINW